MGLPVPPNNQPAGTLWDQAAQGSDHPPVPNQLIIIPGGPNNVIYAPPGTIVKDDAGGVWVKGSAYDVNSGWTQLTVP